MTETADRYVYGHLAADGSVVYIGSGTAERCLSRSKRANAHKVFMDGRQLACGLDFVVTLASGLTPDEAYAHEYHLIHKLRPYFNRMGVTAANAGRGTGNHNSRFTKAEAEQHREQWANHEGSLRSYHREYLPHVAFTTARKLLLGYSYT